jgi:hypothetical protein
VVIDGADHMEAAGHDPGLGEVFAHRRAVTRRQIHADYLHQMLAFEALQVAFQRHFAAAEHQKVVA